MKRFFAVLLALCLICGSSCALAANWARAYRHGDEDSPKIAITMDDCWDVTWVEAMLDVCKEYGIHMTFFPCGSAVKEKDQAIWQRLLDEGHEIGSHTQSHANLEKRSFSQIRTQMDLAQKRVNRVLGYEYPLRLMRPPGGAYGSSTAKYLGRLGYEYIIMWNVNNIDPALAHQKVKNGCIMLYHARHKDVEGLKKLIPQLLEEGYQPVTVSELIGLEPVEYEKDDASNGQNSNGSDPNGLTSSMEAGAE